MKVDKSSINICESDYFRKAILKINNERGASLR